MKKSTSDLCDHYSDDLQILEPLYQNYGQKQEFEGQVVTVKCFEDNSMVKQLSTESGHGKVLVVDGGGSLRHALLGDLIAAKFVENGWSGLVIHGCVRDVEILKTMDLGVRALNSIPIKSVRKGLGETGVPIRIAGANINSGDWIYADETGIIVSEKQLAED